MSNGIVLAVDMTDPSGGKGAYAAIKTAQALGGYAQVAVSAVSVQTPEQMLGIWPVPAAVVVDQMRAAFSSYSVGAILLGLLPGKDVIDAVGDLLDNLKPKVPVIVDPVIESRDGKRFLDKPDIDALKRRILIHADLLMPSIGEAEHLTGQAIRDEQTMEHAAEMLLTLGARNVLLKGETLEREKIYEIYVDDRRTQVFESERLPGRNIHGAGSTLAAAAAVLVAQGNTPRESVVRARAYLEEMIRNASDFDGEASVPLRHAAQ
ncbi:MAG: bifunctional hydroxymethylpyrimidine kinase/phosphomethylpyrimidine kinase [Rhodospirillales bacterium]|nr:bifunctional hydroxymethylpyrimidine kinase/phosphomethylpyrimidine kinase [Alphaproteobacteria bacterium]MCB9987586.1 bifunctional hydroxymethylpyrimidine kinase/phosphomethylpyrimidine kinase [Rhodospirillales bacterium]USO07697.1 MAG: bifunctional hydroxymethylpyrimidine kinase/phosphomethylpyrimidine kinase [Rhodospirillales bacterium]